MSEYRFDFAFVSVGIGFVSPAYRHGRGAFFGSLFVLGCLIPSVSSLDKMVSFSSTFYFAMFYFAVFRFLVSLGGNCILDLRWGLWFQWVTEKGFYCKWRRHIGITPMRSVSIAPVGRVLVGFCGFSRLWSLLLVVFLVEPRASFLACCMLIFSVFGYCSAFCLLCSGSIVIYSVEFFRLLFNVWVIKWEI